MKELETLKNRYQEITLTDNQIRTLNQTVSNAKRKPNYIKRLMPAISLVLALVLIPNVSVQASNTLQEIPVLGNLVKAITIREYFYQEEKKEAIVDLTKINIENNQVTSDSINKKIHSIAGNAIESFKDKCDKDGYEYLKIDTSIISANDHYFTLRMNCYESIADGYMTSYFFTYSIVSSKEVTLNDLYKSNYKEVINKEIISKMRNQMKDDKTISYFIDDDTDNFESISDNQNFYFDKDGNIVIHFDEGEVGPSSNGECEFTISKTLLTNYLK